jgi:Arc/MetJ-type ribon-helix-helix transcriptional regulator
MAMNVSLLHWTGWVERRVKNKEFSSVSECIRHCIRMADAIERVSGPAGASFSTRAELEHVLEEAFAAPAAPLTQERKRRIARDAGL